jgi:hypothetical protein
MDTSKHLIDISQRLTEIIEDVGRIMDYITNSELYSVIDNNIKSHLETVQTHIDIAIDDLDEGMYEDMPMDEEDEEWD